MTLGRSRYPEEREFYMSMVIQERWNSWTRRLGLAFTGRCI